MNRAEILSELQQIALITNGVDVLFHNPEAAERADKLYREFERGWPPESQQAPPEGPQGGDTEAWVSSPPYEATEAPPPIEKHIDTPDELLELLAGISSDPQIEGLSLAQKASTIALLHIANAVERIAQNTDELPMELANIAGGIGQLHELLLPLVNQIEAINAIAARRVE